MQAFSPLFHIHAHHCEYNPRMKNGRGGGPGMRPYCKLICFQCRTSQDAKTKLALNTEVAWGGTIWDTCVEVLAITGNYNN